MSGSPIQYVTLVSGGGTPIRLANQSGTPYPTTGYGSIVFSLNPTLNGATFTGPVYFDEGRLGFSAGSAVAPSIFFDEVANKDGFFSSGAGHVNTAINGMPILDVAATGISITGNFTYSGTLNGVVPTPLTTRGDIYYRGETGNTRLPLGSPGTVLGSTGVDATWITIGAGTVTSIAAGTGIAVTPTDPLTSTGTIALATVAGLAPGSYGSSTQSVSMLVDTYGRITSISNQAISLPNYLLLAGGTLSGPLTGTTATFSGNVTGNTFITAPGAGLFNSGATSGINISGGNVYNEGATYTVFSNAGGNAHRWMTAGYVQRMALDSTNLYLAVPINGTTATFSGNMTAASGVITGGLSGVNADFTGVVNFTGDVNGTMQFTQSNTSTAGASQVNFLQSAGGRFVNRRVSYTGQYLLETGTNIVTRQSHFDSHQFAKNSGTVLVRIQDNGLSVCGPSIGYQGVFSHDDTAATLKSSFGNLLLGSDNVIRCTISSTGAAFTSKISLVGNVEANAQLISNITVVVGAGTASQAFVKSSSTTDLGLYYGTGAPTFSAAKGSLYTNTTATTTTTRLYVNTNGSTTWTNLTTAA